jgi:type II secretory pathway component GspD/PulD (secretin)
MIFIRPKILRDGAQAAFVTGAKYNYMRDEQIKADKRELLPLLRGQEPRLEPLPAPSETPQTTPARPSK